MKKSTPALWLAAALSLALSVAAGVSGWQRGGNALESTLWAGLSVLAVLVVHIMPAMLYWRGWLALLAFPVWLGVFAVVVFGHAQFFTLAEIHAGRERALQAVANRTDTPALIQPPAKAATLPRTAASVARDLAKATAALVWLPQAKRPAQQQAVDALRLELATVQQAEAREAASLANQRASIEARQADPVGLRLGQVLGLSTEAVMLAVALATALVLELASVILWHLALVVAVPCEPTGNPANERRLLSSLAGFWKRRRTGRETTPARMPKPGNSRPPKWGSATTPGPDAQSGHLDLQPAPEAPPVLTSDEPEKRETAQPDSEPVTSSNDAQAILTLLRAKGAVSLGTLQASVSKRLRPVLADLLAALESAGQIKVTAQGRGRLVELA